MFKYLRTNVDKMGAASQFISYLLLGVLMFGMLTVVYVLSGADKRIAWLTGTIAITLWTSGLIIWLGRQKNAKKTEKNVSANPS